VLESHRRATAELATRIRESLRRAGLLPTRESLGVDEEEALLDEVAALKARAARTAERHREKTDLLNRLGLPGMDSAPRRTGGPTVRDLFDRWRDESGISQDRIAKVEVCVRRFGERAPRSSGARLVS
jgi:hypothetical protein